MSHCKQQHSDHPEKSFDKLALKELETPEEKRLRRFAKKEAKERKRKAKMGWDEDYMGYTNTDNPFGDTNLLNAFVWKKKLEKEGLIDVNQEEFDRRNLMKLEQNRLELKKVKQRRLEREREQEMREEELIRIQREKEAAQFSEWCKQEDIFHLHQAKLRSKIRIQDGRAKPIDLLARYVSPEEDHFTVEMQEPYVYLKRLKGQDLEDLLEDIKTYMELENGKNLDYWKDLQIIVEDEIHKLYDTSSSKERRESINAAVCPDIVNTFKGKTPKQLQAMYRLIEKQISGNQDGTDVAYWETLLSRLNAYMAQTRLKERHQENLRHKLYELKQEQGVEQPPLFPCVSITTPGPSMTPSTMESTTSEKSVLETSNPDPTDVKKDRPGISEKSEVMKGTEEDYDTGRCSPILLRPEKLEPGVIVIDPSEDAVRLEFMQRRMLKSDSEEMSAEDKAFDCIDPKGMDALFSVEQSVDRIYLWSDKYRPRKPRYLNRVHTGFEWNKYNRTHYDTENPPPKTVQGYKFNIFYPDLIDKSKTPEYTLKPCDDDEDFSVLRFHAGPPYEDIAFKIVNRQWECSYKRGFRCQFQNNIFQLWFHFKRYCYRR